MTTLTIPQVRGWDPTALDTAASQVGKASTSLDHEAKSVSRAVEEACIDWKGMSAEAALDRASQEAKTGAQLADALADARNALSRGGADLGHSRTHLINLVDTAQGEGYQVAADGGVTPPTAPPVMSSPERVEAAQAEWQSAQDKLNQKAQDYAEQISAALTSVADIDADVASALGKITFPESLRSKVEAYLERLVQSKDLIGSLGAAGAGAVALAQVIKSGVGIFNKGSAYLKFLKASTAPITDIDTLRKNFAAADDAIATFMKGKANGGVMRFLMGSKFAKVAGKAFLPVTLVSGLVDTFTGGGYDGARGWATRGFGLAGAAGAGALMASSAGLIALGPVGLGVAGAAVLGYGAWQLGNLAWDHREEIGKFFKDAGSWTADRASDVAHWTSDRVDDAKDWAKDRVSDVEDAGKSAVHKLSFGLL